MKVEKIKAQRQRQIGNVQKQLLNNYFLQKYSNIMTKITNSAQAAKPPVKSQPKQVNNKINFKKVILQKKGENENSQVQRKLFVESPRKQKKHQNLIELSQRSNAQQQYNSIDEKTLKQLQQSIVNDLYKQSPTQLERGFYSKLQIQRNREGTLKKQQQNVQPSLNQVINITYDSEFMEVNRDEDENDKQYERSIKYEIKRNFSNRKSRQSSPKKSAQKYKQSEVKSSNVSIQIKIQSPKEFNRVNNQKKLEQASSQRGQIQPNKRQHSKFKQDIIKQDRQGNQSKGKDMKGPQIHFARQMVKPHQIDENQRYQPQNSHIQEEIQFIAPTSNYYQSQNPNFVQETFRLQQRRTSKKDVFSESQSPFAQHQRQSNNQVLRKVDSKKSLRSASKDQTQVKDSSQIEMSFVSRLSLISSDEGYNIRNSIEKQLFDNQLGPYQSALYNVLELIQKYPRSGPVYAVGQRTLQDRKNIEQRKRSQALQIQQYKKKIQALKKKGKVVIIKGQDESIIKHNKLEILRLIRKLSNKL